MSPKSKVQSPKRPFVFINMAMTADGKIATSNRVVHSFGSQRDLEHLYELRATADAVLCGARTVEISQATLGNGSERFRRRRIEHGLAEYPLRVLVSGSGSLNPAAPIFQKHFSPIVLLTTRRAAKSKLAALQNVVAEIKIAGAKEIDFGAALRWLHDQWNVKRLLCEGGGELNDSLFRADLVDEINITFCPKIFGGRSAPTIADGIGFPKLGQATRFRISSKKAKNGELFTVLSREQ